MKTNCREFLLVFGPPESGKTLNAAAMKKMLGFDHVFDADFARREIAQARGKIILLSHSVRVRNPDRRREFLDDKMAVSVVKRLLGSEWVEPVRQAQEAKVRA